MNVTGRQARLNWVAGEAAGGIRKEIGRFGVLSGSREDPKTLLWAGDVFGGAEIVLSLLTWEDCGHYNKKDIVLFAARTEWLRSSAMGQNRRKQEQLSDVFSRDGRIDED